MIAELGDSGLAGLAVESVATRAGVRRMTIYRRFSDRERLIDTAIGCETTRLLATVWTRVGRAPLAGAVPPDAAERAVYARPRLTPGPRAPPR